MRLEFQRVCRCGFKLLQQLLQRWHFVYKRGTAFVDRRGRLDGEGTQPTFFGRGIRLPDGAL